MPPPSTRSWSKHAEARAAAIFISRCFIYSPCPDFSWTKSLIFPFSSSNLCTFVPLAPEQSRCGWCDVTRTPLLYQIEKALNKPATSSSVFFSSPVTGDQPAALLLLAASLLRGSSFSSVPPSLPPSLSCSSPASLYLTRTCLVVTMLLALL